MGSLCRAAKLVRVWWLILGFFAGTTCSKLAVFKGVQLQQPSTSLRSGHAGGLYAASEQAEVATMDIVITGCPDFAKDLNGAYHRAGDQECYVRVADDSSPRRALTLKWGTGVWRIFADVHGKQVQLAHMYDSSGKHLIGTNQWSFLNGQSLISTPSVRVSLAAEVANTSAEILGVPRRLLPYYAAFLFDSMAVGLVLPLLPFYIMELGASALQLSLVVSANYLAQMVGCIVMGKVSDAYGRRPALLACLLASALSYYSVSHAHTVTLVAAARAISGALGGLVPVLQSAVADASTSKERPKYLGRVMATFGLGFVLGPAISTVLPESMSTAQKIRLGACLPLIGLVIAVLFAQETRPSTSPTVSATTVLGATSSNAAGKGHANTAPLTRETGLLILCGFLNMFAFGTETIYAVFLKDTFGFGESTMSGLFAVNGLITGVFQVFLIKPLIAAIGMPSTLVLGNLLLGLGMLGLALVRAPAPHFVLFGCHILGYAIADTALVSLISRSSAPRSQGRDLSLNQAAQSCARIASPLLAGMLYEYSRQLPTSGPLTVLPTGALPFLVGSLCPLLGAGVSLLLNSHQHI